MDFRYKRKYTAPNGENGQGKRCRGKNGENLINNGGNDVVAAVSALGYDAYMTAVAAIEKAQSTDGTAIRDALAGLSIDAVTGSISFDANGDAIKSTAYIKQAIDGGFQFYKVQNAD